MPKKRAKASGTAWRLAAGCITIAANSAGAYAQCAGAAGPFASSSDAATSQVMDTVRERRLQVAQGCAPGSFQTAGGMCVAATPTSAPGPAPSGGGQAAPVYKPVRMASSMAPDLTRTRYGVWSEGFADYERRDNVGPTTSSTRFTSYGVLAGIDHTYFLSAREGFLVGGLAGYSHARGDFSGASAKTQDFDGGSIGAYAAYFYNKLAIDTAFKLDNLNVDQTGIGGCTATGSTNVVNYVLAVNISHRSSLGHQLWFEPTFGIRYSQSDFGSNAGTLGLADGHALRLLGGARIGTDWVEKRALYSVSFLGALYSDVVVDGFVVAGGTTSTTNDEGALRALGQLKAKVTYSDGLSYFGQVEVRGGADYFGVGGKVGVRVEW